MVGEQVYVPRSSWDPTEIPKRTVYLLYRALSSQLLAKPKFSLYPTGKSSSEVSRWRGGLLRADGFRMDFPSLFGGNLSAESSLCVPDVQRFILWG